MLYRKTSTTRLDMTDIVKRICQTITLQILEGVLWNFKHRLNLCLETNGAHFEL